MSDYKSTLNLPKTDFPMKGNLSQREPDQIERWRARDPIRRLQGWLEENGLIDEDDLVRIEAEVRTEVEAALVFAEAGTAEPVEDVLRFVTMDEVPA